MYDNKILITSENKKFKINLKELWHYKDLLYFLVYRDITVIYKQSILGFSWAIINPLFSTLIFSFVFGKIANISSDGIPYPVFSLLGVIPWTYFSGTVNASGSSLISSSSIFTKVYFPRLIIPITPVLSKLMDFTISLSILVIFFIYFGILPGVNLVFFPLVLILMIITSSGIGFWFSALAIQYRDVKFGLTFITPLLMYIAPVVFPASLILEKYGYNIYLFYGIYPLSGIIESFRALFINSISFPWELFLISFISSSVIFITGLMFYTKKEKYFADVA
ncbi:MAG: ABC transporter permease [Ignavibacteria bacterium]|nr:ABC transporter permease [Ignavibacteria bacterium]